MGEAVFTYGSLEFADVMEAVTGRRFAADAALLEGHRRRLLRGRVYPAIVPAAGERTDGTLYHGIDAGSLGVLDEFESDVYDRVIVQVKTLAGLETPAHAWVLRPAHVELLGLDEWDRERFLREHHTSFVAACRRFHSEGVWSEPP